LGNIFGFCKTRHILLSDSANCTGLRAVVLTQYCRVTDGRTDGQTDGIDIANTSLAVLCQLTKASVTDFVNSEIFVSISRVPVCVIIPTDLPRIMLHD